MNNYPDDIHAFDNHPDSPLYDSSDDELREAIELRADEILAELKSESFAKTVVSLQNATLVSELEESISCGSDEDLARLTTAVGNYMHSPNSANAEYIARRIVKMYSDYWLQDEDTIEGLKCEALKQAEEELTASDDF